MSFDGFPPAARDFLRRLERNNERSWFHAHRDEYEATLLEPARDFVVAIGELFPADVHAEPKVGGSIFRIARDTRFSADKRPYKTHLDLWFWQGARPSRACPGYFFRLTPERLYLGAGMHRFERPVLERYREAVADDDRGAALTRALSGLGDDYELGGRRYKRVPAGFDAPPERVELLLHDGLYVGLDLPVPAEAHTAELPRFCLERYRPLAPLQDWVVALTA